MSKCLLQKLVPFLLTIFAGIAIASLFGLPVRRTWTSRVSFDGPSKRRTPLVIKSIPEALPAPSFSRECERCSVRMRLMFGPDGTVSGNEYQLEPSSYGLVESATRTSREIEFVPATRGGRPIAVYVYATYTCGANEFPGEPYACGLLLEAETARSQRGRQWQVKLPTHD